MLLNRFLQSALNGAKCIAGGDVVVLFDSRKFLAVVSHLRARSFGFRMYERSGAIVGDGPNNRWTGKRAQGGIGEIGENESDRILEVKLTVRSRLRLAGIDHGAVAI